jgi:hypothetical protein
VKEAPVVITACLAPPYLGRFHVFHLRPHVTLVWMMTPFLLGLGAAWGQGAEAAIRDLEAR